MAHSGLTRVAIVDPHDLFVECIELVLDARGYECHQIPVPADQEPLGEFQSRLEAVRPHVALIDASFGPGRRGTTLIATAARARIPVAALTGVHDEAHWGQCLAAGARVVVPKSDTLASMVSAIRRLSRGEQVLDLVERERLLALGNRRIAEVRAARYRMERLTEQEGVVLRALMGGRTVGEIAASRGVSEATVRTQVKSVLGKLEVSSQLSAVALAHLGGWIAQPRAHPAGSPRRAEVVA